VRRTNTFRLSPTKEQEQKLFLLAENCARMFNEINYKRRQSLFSKNFDWNTDLFYHKYKKVIGSATAQQVTRKNNEAWKSFFALLRLKKQGKLPEHIRKVSPPGYWKDGKTGKRVLTILIRCNCYKLDDKRLKLPSNLEIKWKGKNKWKGKKQGRLEIRYDDLSKKWYAQMPVEVEKPPPPLHQPKGDKKKEAYVDLGVKVPIMACVDGEVFGYKANSMLSDWWYLNKKKIAKHQEELKKKNNKHRSKRLKALYRKRKRRFRDKVNKIVKDFVEKCWAKGVSEIICGDLRGIRKSANFNKKSNSMIHNFWSVGQVYKRLKEKAEEYGIKTLRIDERGTSSTCPRCSSKKIVRHKRLFRCKECKLEAHRDAVGCVNIGNIRLAQGDGSAFPAGVVNRAVARPSLATLHSVV
jgi:putative transposase